MIEVLLADNQDLINEGSRAILAGIMDIQVRGSAADAVELAQQMKVFTPNVIIIDPNYNERFTLRDLKQIRSTFKQVNILVLSNRQSRGEIQRVIDLGIRNYVFKECGREELINAIYTTAKGEQYFCKNTFEVLFGNKLVGDKGNAIPQLSAREIELVHLIAEGLTNNEIAERLFLSVHTVKTHRKNILKKLGFTFKNTSELATLLLNWY